MEAEEKVIAKVKKKNMKIYSIHRTLTFDLLFYYAIKFLFLTQVKGLTAGDIVTASAFWGIFKVIFQIPVTTFIDKVGDRKSLIIADLVQAFSVILIMLSSSLPMLIFANLFGAMAFAMKEVAESGILNLSIPEVENRSQIYSKIDGKALSNYYYISAISAILSGILFDINGYIPMIICVIILLISALISSKFQEIKTNKEENIKIQKRYKTYFKDLKLAFSFIFNSRRLKSLMLYSGIMYGMIMVMGTYEMGLLDEVGVSATGTGAIYAIMQIIAGIASKKHNEFHEKYRNKSLAMIGIPYTLACLVAGLIAISPMPQFIIVAIIVITYIIRYLDTGFYYVLIKKYITNFTNIEVSNKVYSAHGLVTGIGNSLVCAFGAIIVSHNSITKSMIILGIVFFIIMIAVIQYMSTRVGLKPTDYRKKDINYKEYISLK